MPQQGSQPEQDQKYRGLDERQPMFEVSGYRSAKKGGHKQEPEGTGKGK